MKSISSPVNFISFLILFFIIPNLVQGQATKVIVRAKAKDAKFIGTSVGGAFIKIKDFDTGELLASGLTKGSTGNTGLLMRQEHNRYTQLSDDQTAKFEASLDIEEPTFVTIEAHAPYTKKQARVVASTQLWLIPGKDITGDGIILEIPGFIIDILSPRTHQFIDKSNLTEGQLKISANVVMMCGCTISKGGLWNGSEMEVSAIIKKNDKIVQKLPLQINNIPNLFEVNATFAEPGNYELLIYAYDPKTNNTGVDKVNFIIE